MSVVLVFKTLFSLSLLSSYFVLFFWYRNGIGKQWESAVFFFLFFFFSFLYERGKERSKIWIFLFSRFLYFLFYKENGMKRTGNFFLFSLLFFCLRRKRKWNKIRKIWVLLFSFLIWKMDGGSTFSSFFFPPEIQDELTF